MANFGVTWSAVLTLFFAGSVFAQEPTAAEKFSIWLPAKPWALELEAPGMALKRNEIQADGRRYFLAESDQTHLIASVFLENMKGPALPGECKRSLEDKQKRNASLSLNGLKGVAYWESAGMEILEFSMPEVNGVPANQKNIFACLIKDDVFVDIHISKILFKAADQPAFDDLLRSFHFVAKEPVTAVVPAGNSLRLFQQGSRYFIAQDYRGSIAPYQQALDIERVSPTLEKKLWYVLVDNLAMAYGITNDMARSQKVIEYGISKDPDYPMFYYNLACIAGEKGDARNAKANLKLAYDRRGNVLPGESFADARSDDSFQKLMQDPEFRRFVDNLYAGKP
jgi:tetratricopeptide (TPR) repeat protein